MLFERCPFVAEVHRIIDLHLINAISNLLLLQFGIERVTQTVTHQVLNASTVSRIASPGKVTTNERFARTGNTSESMVPHSGVGGCAPTPRKAEGGHIENGVRENRAMPERSAAQGKVRGKMAGRTSDASRPWVRRHAGGSHIIAVHLYQNRRALAT